ncbi:28S ribosomal protein S14, mitochondrial [Neodiprion fabricii]|uniref:28S ribosomal protein S14, mitochondrial n=1 Tax=Neodiprion fabricii TaxID=2872261 RepID=UPI001ED8D52C|nr:28S ribosomal protein S14, mitochondrial [Neodiprion fabricii]
MSALGTGVSVLSKYIWKAPELAGFGFQQVRNKWVGWKMIRDVKRRNLVKQHAPERLRINSIRKNNILPPELREIADQEIAAFPRDSGFTRIHNRCVITSRARSVIPRWRVSRIVFRDLADHNLLSGVQRAMW